MRLGQLARFPMKLAGALRRNGPADVWRFARTMVGRYGVGRTLAYAFATPENRRTRLAALERPTRSRPPLWRAQATEKATDRLDAAYTMSGRLWRIRVEAVNAAPARKAMTEPPVEPGLATVRLIIDDSGDGDVAATARGFGGDWARTSDPEAVARMLASASTDDWVVTLKAGDLPSSGLAPALVATAVRQAPVHVLSFDMAARRADGRVRPVLLPGANAWLARFADLGFGRYAFRCPPPPGASGYERLHRWLADRAFSEARDRWRHIAQVLVEVNAPDDELVAQRAVARSRSEAASASGRDPSERVSLIVCTHERGHLLRQLVQATDLEDPRIFDLVVVSNNTRGPVALETLDWIRTLPKCTVLVRDEPFNFSKFSNDAAAAAGGNRLLFLNDDITPVSPDWLEPLLQPLRDPAVGVSGPLLLYPNERVQHAGMYLGYRGAAGHALRHARLPDEDYLFQASAPREVSAVTGAVMMVRRDVFDALGGFDQLLPTFLQDVDLCLRAQAVGWSTIFTPSAVLLHMESATLLSDEGALEALAERQGRERARFLARWSLQAFQSYPFHNPAFDREDETLHTLAPS